jgi:hypothetical protein
MHLFLTIIRIFIALKEEFFNLLGVKINSFNIFNVKLLRLNVNHSRWFVLFVLVQGCISILEINVHLIL